MNKIERGDEEQTPREWAEEYAKEETRRVASSDACVVAQADTDIDDLADETETGVLVLVVESDHYWQDIRAPREEIPDYFDPDEDFPA